MGVSGLWTTPWTWSVLFNIAATVFDLEILWKVLSMSISLISYWSISMLWVFLVCEPLLERDLDLECLPLPGLWHLSVLLLHAGVLPLCQSELCLLLHEDLQHELKWFLKPRLWHFLPNAGQSLNWWVVLHLLHVLLSLVLWLLTLCEPLDLIPFLPCLKVLIASSVVSCVIPPFDLLWLKSFTVISCSFAYWSRAWYVTSSHLFFDRTHFFTLKCLVAWNKSSVLCTSFSSVEYWHLLTRFLIHWSSWSVDSLSPCLMSLYISSIWLQYEVETSRVSVMALETFSGSFWASSSVDIGKVFNHLIPSLPR